MELHSSNHNQPSYNNTAPSHEKHSGSDKKSVVAMLIVVVFWLLGAATESEAVPIGNSQGSAEFPAGAVSFADAVVGYSVGTGGVSAANSGAANALDVPDYSGGGACAGNVSDCSFVSLGAGGSLVLQFIDNLLTGSNSSDFDLWIFEVGPDVEDTYVDISADGSSWFSVGSVGGSTSGIDLDAYGFGAADAFGFVRLTDVAGEGGTSGASAGADIDAVGAISTILASVPEPSTVILLALGISALLLSRRRL